MYTSATPSPYIYLKFPTVYRRPSASLFVSDVFDGARLVFYTSSLSKHLNMSSQSFASSLLEIVNELLEPNDFKISTWMAMGATLMLLAQCYLPASLGSSLPILYLSFRLVKMIIDTFRLHTGCFTNMMRGRWTATLSEPGDAADANNGSDGNVMFVLGERLNQYVKP